MTSKCLWPHLLNAQTRVMAAELNILGHSLVCKSSKCSFISVVRKKSCDQLIFRWCKSRKFERSWNYHNAEFWSKLSWTFLARLDSHTPSPCDPEKPNKGNSEVFSFQPYTTETTQRSCRHWPIMITRKAPLRCLLWTRLLSAWFCCSVWFQC